MGNKQLFNLLIVITLVMILVCIVLYIWTFIRVRNGSNIKDVRRIVILMIASSFAAFVVILDGLFLMHQS
jgi:ABC-type transport system involved in cytochrome bd biosynthesis fused ATPase/permease subunit